MKMTAFETRPGNKPILIDQEELDLLRNRFEREVIDPLFFGHSASVTDDEIKQLQRRIDSVVDTFEASVRDTFEISNQTQLSNC